MQRITKELVDKFGIGGALAIMRSWGNRELYVPVKVDILHPLALSLGLELAQGLVRAYAGQRLQLPAERSALLDMRNQAIAADLAKGDSHATVALRYGLTRQAVGGIGKRLRLEAGQPVADTAAPST